MVNWNTSRTDQSTGWTLLTSTRAWVRILCDSLCYLVNTVAVVVDCIYCPLLFVFSLLSSSFLIPLYTATAAVAMWTIRVKGRLFHSGLPHKGINSIELASEAMAYIQRRFYEDFPPVSYITPLNPPTNPPTLSLPPSPSSHPHSSGCC